MRDLYQLRKRTGANLCVECGKCSSLCPLAPYEDFSAARTMSLFDPATEMPHYATAIERCLTCGTCEIRCPQGVRYTEYVRGLRVDLPGPLRRPRPHGAVFQTAAKVAGQGSRPRHRPRWLEPDLRIAEEGDLALFVGCLPLFDIVFAESFGVETIEMARSAIRLLNAVDIEPVLIPGESCCGHDLLWGGDRAGFESQARVNCRLFREAGIRHIVTACAECCRTWRLDYPEVVAEYQPKVEHLAEFLSRSADADGTMFRSSGDGLVTFQDPCRLGRHLGMTEPPRQLLDAVPDLQLVEMERSGVDALCCGTSGFVHCDAVSRRLQASRLRQAADTGAGKLLTACPKCLLHFHCAQSEDRRLGRPLPDLEVEDLGVYLAARLANPTSPPNGVDRGRSESGEQP